MKKLIMFFAVAAMAVSASAQGTALTGQKFGDNWYIGVNAGVGTATTHNAWTKNLIPNAGLRLGKNLTPVFGLALEGNVYFSEKDENFGLEYNNNLIPEDKNGTVVREVNVNLLGTFNLMNMFGGYKGTPRSFEMIAVGGFGWGHPFGTNGKIEVNYLTSKLGLDFAFNFGADKQYQFYVEPSINYMLVAGGADLGEYHYDGGYNIDKSMVQLNAGFVYKFMTSNGTHNFAFSQLRDQNQIDGLNNKINALRSDVDAKAAALAAAQNEINNLKNKLANQKPVVQAVKSDVLQPCVIFKQGKSNIEESQKIQVAAIAKYLKENPNAKVVVEGYASPEGSAELNQQLSQARAEVVKEALVNKYGIDESRIEAKACGITDKLFEEYDFNRVSIFKGTK